MAYCPNCGTENGEGARAGAWSKGGEFPGEHASPEGAEERWAITLTAP